VPINQRIEFSVKQKIIKRERNKYKKIVAIERKEKERKKYCINCWQTNKE
jgi:hypothetical protein